MDSVFPFAAILAGQPTLNRQLRLGMFAALDQRIATRFTIKPMDLAESAAYLKHYLALAGRDEPHRMRLERTAKTMMGDHGLQQDKMCRIGCPELGNPALLHEASWTTS